MRPFYTRLPDVGGFGIESKVDMIGAAAAVGATAGVVAHAAMQGLHNIRSKKSLDIEVVGTKKEDHNG
jgi:Ni,Fe-hydrogenase I small subunit